MTSSGRQQPDNAMYLGDEVGSSSETCSSPMLWMERKATIGAADLFCLQRWKVYTNINFITTFAFPNMQDPCCLTEITAAWKNFYFSTKLTNHTIQWRVRYRISNKHSVLQSSPSVANKSHIIQWIEPQLWNWWRTIWWKERWEIPHPWWQINMSMYILAVQVCWDSTQHSPLSNCLKHLQYICLLIY